MAKEDMEQSARHTTKDDGQQANQQKAVKNMEIHFQEVQKETEGMLGFPDQVRFNAHNREKKSLGHSTLPW